MPGTGNTATFNAAAGAGGTVIDLGISGVTVTTIIFTGPNCDAYTIGAGAINSQSLTLNGSGNAGFSSGTTFSKQITVNAAITVNNSQQWVLNAGANPYIINGNVTPNGTAGSTIQVKNNGHSCTFNGVLADQVGGAKLQMAGANAQTATLTNPNNSFTGGLYFDNGTVSVNSIGLIGSPSAAGAGGDLLFGSGFGGGTLVFTGAGTFTTDRVISINQGFNGPTITQSGASGLLKFTADVAFSSAATSVGSPTLTLNGATAGSGEISGKIVDNPTIGNTPLKDNATNGSTTLKLHSVDGIVVGAAVSGSPSIQAGTTATAINTSTKTITISPATSGAQINQGASITVGGLVNITYLTKSGSGTWTLSGANTHSGFTKISAGTLTLANSLALQNSPIDMVGSITGTSSAGLKTTVTTLTLGGLNGTASPKNLSSIFTTTAGGYNGVTALTLNPRAGASLSYSGVIADGATGMSLIKTGAGTQTLSGANIYSGATTVSAGKLALGANNVLPDGTAVSIDSATLDAATYTDTAGTLDVTNAATINLGSGGALAFADSSPIDWTGGTLNITGTFVSGSSLRFGTTSTGLTATQLGLISKTGGGTTFGLDSSGYLIALVTVQNLNYTNAPNTGLLIPIASITNLFTSSQPTPNYTFVNIPATSMGGGTIVTNATTIQYTPPGGNPSSDTFTYYVNDGVATSPAATVTVYFQSVAGPQINPASITQVGGTNQFTFQGIPSTGYHVQVATTLSPTPDWANADSGSTTGLDGSFVWTDSVSQATRLLATGQVYYRISYP